MKGKKNLVNFFKKKEFVNVIDYFKKNSELKRDYDSLIILGISYSALAKYEEALNYFSQARDLNYSVEALYNIAITLSLLNKIRDSKNTYLKILQIDKNHLSSYINLSDIHIQAQDYQHALDLLTEIVSKNPDNLLLNYNYSVALIKTKKYSNALKHLNKVINIDDTFLDAYYNKANCLKNMGFIDEAVNIYEEILSKDSQHTDSKFNLGICLLLKGKYEKGLELYENRFLLSQNYNLTHQPSGGNLLQEMNVKREAKILVIYEQGFGDSINFSCYINFLLEIYDNVFVLIQPELLSLFKNSFECEFYSNIEDIPPYDYYIFMASLPLYITRKDHPLMNNKPYLKVSSNYLEKWRPKIDCQSKKIGIAWCSANTSLLKRDFDDECFLGYLPDKFNYYCLHKEISSYAKKTIYESKYIHEFCDDIQDFHDTAAICSLMDYIITIDTSVAHIASALGKNTQLALSHVPDWRWQLMGEQSVWYKNTKLIRSKKEDENIDLMNRLDFNFS